MLSRTILLEAAFATSSVLAAASCPGDSPLSCSTDNPGNTCCVESPGGQILLTQFWDTDPVTGPSDSWTIHGLWPDNCDGTYEANCDDSRAYSNISSILQDSAPETLSYMEKYWKDYKGDDETFWEHEWSKHGTCMSTLEPDCYEDYQPTQEASEYFTRAVELFKSLPSYTWLDDAGITPSSSKTYTLAEIQDALSSQHGSDVIINCDGSELNELWYQFNLQGSVTDGKFVAADPVGPDSTCPDNGIKYLPKSNSSRLRFRA